MVVVIIVVEVLQHKKCPALGLLRREHIHKRFISKGGQSEATLAMNLCCFLLVIQLTRLFACGDHLSGQLPWKKLQLCKVLQEVICYHVGGESSRHH